MNNDFAILTLEDPLDLVSEGSVIRAICLPPDNPPHTYVVNQTMFTVSGWGLLEEGGEDQAEVLHHVQVPYRHATNSTRPQTIYCYNFVCYGYSGGLLLKLLSRVTNDLRKPTRQKNGDFAKIIIPKKSHRFRVTRTRTNT